MWLVDLAVEAGADAVKFQHYTAETLVSDVGFQNLDGSVETHQSKWKESVSLTYDKASLNREWTEELCEEAHKYNLGFFTSPYSEYLVDFVEQNVDAYKIGSGDITYTKIIDQISKKGKPVLIATGAANIDEVKHAMSTLQKNCSDTGIDIASLKFIKGDVCETLKEPDNVPDQISVLRLDTDWYESTKAELEILYPKLSNKGVLIIDDYGHWEGARKAVDEYFLSQKYKPLFNVIDRTGRSAIKIEN